MTPPPLVDLSPMWQMMFVGLLLAGVALGWLWLRHGRGSTADWVGAATVLTLFLTFDLVLFGAFTRLTDSGLGCPDWPGCYGSGSPVGANAPIAAAQSAMPSGPVTHQKAWIEMVHRYMATGVGALILYLTIASWRARLRGVGADHGLGPWWSTLTLVWVCIQGAFGALTVTMKLFPAIVTLHLLGAMVLLALLTVQVEYLTRTRRGAHRVSIDPATRTLLLTCFVALVLQLALGGWVSTNYAVLACVDFPTCQNSWWPEMDFRQGFQVWRELGLTAQGEHVSFAALTAIHFAHRLMAGLVLLALWLLAWRLRAVAELRVHSKWIAGLAVLQLASGLGNVVLGWPLAAAMLHSGGAAALVVAMTWAAAASRVSRAEVGQSGLLPRDIPA